MIFDRGHVDKKLFVTHFFREVMVNFVVSAVSLLTLQMGFFQNTYGSVSRLFVGLEVAPGIRP